MNKIDKLLWKKSVRCVGANKSPILALYITLIPFLSLLYDWKLAVSVFMSGMVVEHRARKAYARAYANVSFYDIHMRSYPDHIYNRAYSYASEVSSLYLYSRMYVKFTAYKVFIL